MKDDDAMPSQDAPSDPQRTRGGVGISEVVNVENAPQNVTGDAAAYEQARQLIRRLAFAIENILDGAEIDDGCVSVSALIRMSEVYEIDIRPLGPSRMPPLLAKEAT